MSSVARRAVSTVGKLLVRQNAIQTTFSVTARNVVSQAGLAQKTDTDDTNQDYGQQSSDSTGSEKEFQMYINNTGDTLSVNLENVSNSLQKEVIDKLGLFLTSEPGLEKIRNVKFNSLSEEVYRHIMYMPFRKLGYDCMFTRYNDDRGLASFKLEDTERNVRRNYYRSGLPNKC